MNYNFCLCSNIMADANCYKHTGFKWPWKLWWKTVTKLQSEIIAEKKIVGLKINLRKIPTKGNNEVSIEEKMMLTGWVKRELTRFSSYSMLMSENQQGSCCWYAAIGKGLGILGFLAGLHMTTELCGQRVHDKVSFRFHGVTLFRNTEMYKIEVDCFVCMLAC